MIELFVLPAGIPENLDRDRPIVVIDIFRASTTIYAALAAGAAEIHFAGSQDEAARLKASLGDRAVLAGERGGHRIDGYDLGNSPLAITPEAVSGRPVIMNSTNGTKLLRRFAEFDHVVVGSVVAASAVARHLRYYDADPIFAAAATEGRFSAEDTLAAGLIISRLDRPQEEMDDAAAAAVRLVTLSDGDWVTWSAQSRHGRYLQSIGFGEDLPYCLEPDRFDFVGIKNNGRIVRREL